MAKTSKRRAVKPVPLLSAPTPEQPLVEFVSSDSLTREVEALEHDPVRSPEKRQQMEAARESLSGLRADPRAVVDVLEACNFPPRTRTLVGNWFMSAGEFSVEAVLARRLQALMEKHGYSLRGLADEAGLAHGTVRNVLTLTRSPGIDTVAQIAAVFGMSPHKLLFDRPEKNGPLTGDAALVKVAESLAKHVPEHGSRHNLDGLLDGDRVPSLATLQRLSLEFGVPLIDLIP